MSRHSVSNWSFQVHGVLTRYYWGFGQIFPLAVHKCTQVCPSLVRYSPRLLCNKQKYLHWCALHCTFQKKQKMSVVHAICMTLYINQQGHNKEKSALNFEHNGTPGNNRVKPYSRDIISWQRCLWNFSLIRTFFFIVIVSWNANYAILCKFHNLCFWNYKLNKENRCFYLRAIMFYYFVRHFAHQNFTCRHYLATFAFLTC